MGNINNYIDFFNCIDSLLFVLDQDGCIIYCNNTVSTKLQYPVNELIGMDVLFLHPENRRQEAADILQRMLIAKDIDVCPVPLLRKDGSLLDVETRVFQGEWDQKPVLFGVSKDIVKQQISQDKFEAIFESTPIPIAVTRISDGYIYDVNKAWLDTLGFEKHEVIGKKTSEIGVVSNLQQRNKLLQVLSVEGQIDSMPVEFARRDGETVYGLFSARPVKINGDPAWVTSLVDKTDEVLLKRELDGVRFEKLHKASLRLEDKMKSFKVVK